MLKIQEVREVLYLADWAMSSKRGRSRKLLLIWLIIKLIFCCKLSINRQSLLDLVLLQHDSVVGCHDDLLGVVVEEVCLEHSSFCFWYQVGFVSLDNSSHVPDDGVLPKSTYDEPFQTLLALIKLCSDESEVLHPIFLNVIQGNFKFDGSWSVIKRHLFGVEGFIKVVFSWDKSEVGSEGGKDPLPILCSVKIDNGLTSWGEFVVGILSNLLVKANLSVFGTCGKTAITWGTDCGKERIATVFLHAADSFLNSRIDFIDCIFWDGLECFEIGCFCEFILRADCDNSFFGAGFLSKCKNTN